MTAILGPVGALRRYRPVFTTRDLNVDERLNIDVLEPAFPFRMIGPGGTRPGGSRLPAGLLAGMLLLGTLTSFGLAQEPSRTPPHL